MTGPSERAWEPEPLELPLESPRRAPRPVRSWDIADEAEPRAGEGERPGSHVVVIDIA